MRVAAALVLLALAACSSEPDFDERFEKVETETQRLAQEIDTELAKSAAGTAQPDQPAAASEPDAAGGRR